MTPTQGEHAQTEASHAIAQLRHLYHNMVGGGVRDAGEAKTIAAGLLAPAIAALETAPAQPAAPQGVAYAELPEPIWRTAQGVAFSERQLYDFADRTHALRTQQPAPAGATYKDSTPGLHVGESAFESWYSTYNPAHKADKQRARDAYAAGMGDPLVTAAPTPQPAPAAQQAGEPARSNCMDCANTDSWGLPDKVFCRTCVSGSHWEPLNRDSVNPNKAAPQPTPTAQAAPAGDLPEDQTQPWYDLAWRHGARRHTSFDGDELTELSFSPTQFDAFCADLAPAAGAVAHTLSDAQIEAMPVWRNFVGLWPESRREIVDAVLDLLAAAPTPAAQADSVPNAQFDDPKVQAVYAILCDDTDWPPKENPQQHWEGWIARRIVDALLEDSVLEDAALLDFIEQHPEMSLRHRKGKWALVGLTNYEYEMLPSLRDAIRAARKQGAKHD